MNCKVADILMEAGFDKHFLDVVLEVVDEDILVEAGFDKRLLEVVDEGILVALAGRDMVLLHTDSSFLGVGPSHRPFLLQIKLAPAPRCR
jgi:hypothetical protein